VAAAAQKATTANEVIWADYVKAIEATLPAGSSITDFSGSLDAPFGGAAITAAPLSSPHVATIQLSVSMTQNPIGGWLSTLPSIKGYVNAIPNSVSKKDSGTYAVVVTIQLNSDAFSGRFTKAAGANK